MQEQSKETTYKRQYTQKQVSRNVFAKALIELMEGEEFDKIQVTQLCYHAQLSRRTFYRLFQSKEEVVCYYINQLCEEYYRMFTQDTDTSLIGVSHIFFNYWYKHAQFLKILSKNHLESLLIKQFTQLLPLVYQSDKKKTIQTKEDEVRSYMAIFCAGGFSNLLLSWMQDNFTKTPEFLCKVVEQTILMNQITIK